MDPVLVKVSIDAYNDEWEKLAKVFRSLGAISSAAKGGSHSPAIQKLVEPKATAEAVKRLAGSKASGAELGKVQKAMRLSKSLTEATAKQKKKVPPPIPLKAKPTKVRKKGLPPPLQMAA